MSTKPNASPEVTLKMTINSDGQALSHGTNEGANTKMKAVDEVVVPLELKEQDLEQIWEWNADVPATLDQCMHQIISDQCRLIPDSPAVESWDGKLTYGELEDLSNSLASYLLSLAIPLDIIPLCFEKSMWTVVAVLAVIKAGAAFVLMDPAQPEARLRTIADQVNANVVLTSASQQALGMSLRDGARVVTVARGSIAHVEDPILPLVPASSKCYLQFTSGSTGTPKGVVISHSNYTSGALPRGEIVGYRAHSRVLDFASYAFDVSIDCMLCTLACGGCICVPSDEARVNDLAGAISSMKVNMAHMTPSVARLLDSDTLSSLEVLGLGGETVSAADAAAWSRHTRIIIAYGPSECTVGCTVNGDVVASDRNPSIGKGVGGVTWIVLPTDDQELLPIGEVGELLVEGPIVGQGYHNDEEKTSKVFIKDPLWLSAGSKQQSGRKGRLYKTGDLAKYDADGSIIFVGRKDTQVKIRGQRVELGEVEHHLRLSLSPGTSVAAEVVIPSKGGDPKLVAFIAFQSLEELDAPQREALGLENENCVAALPPMSCDWVSKVDSFLSKTLPVYMIPSGYIPLSKMPMMVSGKLDRKQLREIGSSLSHRDVSAVRATEEIQRKPETPMEFALQHIWSQLLGVNEEHINANDNFFGLGGDSILVMRLVATARNSGLALTAQAIFTHPRLSDMATIVTSSSAKTEVDITAFSLIDCYWADQVCAEVGMLCRVDPSTIEDVYPCTPLQEGLMALSAKRTEAYVAQRVIEISDQSTEDALRAAWETAVEQCPILRTRIVYVQGHDLLQVVIKEKISWKSSDDLDNYMERDRQSSMQLGSSLARYGIVTQKITGKRHFVWSIHHALYDGFSMPLILERVRQAYQGFPMLPAADYKTYIKYLKDSNQEESRTYWRSQLDGANILQFPPLPSPGYETHANALLERRISLLRHKSSSITVSTIIRSAWALLTAQLTDCDKVVFGETLIGRNAPIVNVDQIEGPMITTVPVAINVDRKMTVDEFLQNINQEAVARITHEHFGLQHIRSLSSDAQTACDLRTGLVIQPGQLGEVDVEFLGGGLAPISDSEAAREALHFNSYALMLVCSLESDGFLVMASFDSACVDVPRMEKVLEQFDVVVQQLCSNSSETLENVYVLNDQILTDQKFALQRDLQHKDHKSVETKTVAVVAHRLPETAMERRLRQLWSDTLGLATEEISKTDHFFRLGGDSISAMKLVAAARYENLVLSVADVFRRPILSDMAHPLSEACKATTTVYAPYSAIDQLGTPLSSIPSLLADPSWQIEDVLPTSALQDQGIKATVSLPRFSVQYNLQYIDSSISTTRLKKAWDDLIVYHEILRTVYITVGGRNFQVVIKELNLPLLIHETDEDVETFTNQLCAADCNSDIPYGSSFLKFMFVSSKGDTTKNCLITRMSHAQYDGICLPNLFLQLKTLYEGGSIPVTPQYSSYIYQTVKYNVTERYEHWHKLLRGSSLSRITRCRQSNPYPGAIFQATEVVLSSVNKSTSRVLDVSQRSAEFTLATLVTAGWSIVLARHLSTTDVTFGHVASGRSVDIPYSDVIMGPCDNHIPARVIFQPEWDFSALLRYVQDQRVNNTKFENTPFRDIIAYADWPADTDWFDSVMHHQDIHAFNDLILDGSTCNLDAINPHPQTARGWKIQSHMQEGGLFVELVSSESWGLLAQELLDELCAVILDICRHPDTLLSARISEGWTRKG